MLSSSHATTSSVLPLAVQETGFLVDRLGQDCHKLQFLRELTQNGIEAIERSGKPGAIVWDVESNSADAQGRPIHKLSITDTGDGMTADEMERYINRLASSGSLQAMTGNFGLGAKIAVATRNPFGVVYQSWRKGQGNMIHLHRDAASGQYGLMQWQLDDDRYAYHRPLSDRQKPAMIDGHGTKVILLGRSMEEDTAAAPSGTPSPSRWVAKYLNSRYFRFPEGVEVRVREGWQHPASDTDRNLLRTVTGMAEYLAAHSSASGSVRLDGAIAHWWILKDEKALSSNSGHAESSGHVAALYQNELYEMKTGLQGTMRLQQFGVVFGTRQVVLYIEPRPSKPHTIAANTARTQLLRDNEPLPWAEWACQFRRKMPRLLRRFIDEKAQGASATDHGRSIRRRLQKVFGLYKISRYRADRQGQEQVADAQKASSGSSAKKAKAANAKSKVKAKSRDDRGNQARSGPTKAAAHGTGDAFPKAVWISTENGTRDEGYLEDRAANFLLEQNLLQINGDFSGFQDMVDHCCAKARDYPGVRDVAETIVRSWFEQSLIETVIGVQQLRQRRHWSPRDIAAALSPEALTAAVMQRYHVAVASTRDLSRRLGKPEARPSSGKTVALRDIARKASQRRPIRRCNAGIDGPCPKVPDSEGAAMHDAADEDLLRRILIPLDTVTPAPAGKCV